MEQLTHATHLNIKFDHFQKMDNEMVKQCKDCRNEFNPADRKLTTHRA